MKKKLKDLVDQTFPALAKTLGIPEDVLQKTSYDIALPKINAHGDLSINLAFQIGRFLKRNPLEVAAACQSVLTESIQRNVAWKAWILEITVEKPGFINFHLTNQAIATQLIEISGQDQRFGTSTKGAGTKVVIEFVSANPTGPLTIAHGRQAAIGDTLARILSAVGYKVHKEFYLNDAGRQIRLLGQSLWARYRDVCGEKALLPEEGYQGAYLIDIAAALKKEKGDSLLKKEPEKALEEVTAYGIQSILENIKKDLTEMRVEFNEYFNETLLYRKKLTDRALEILRKKNLSYEADGALWFRSTQFGDDKDRVLRKKTGEYTYLTPDIAYHQNKFERGFDRAINLWGPDHHGYVPRLKAACQALGFEAKQLDVLIVQLTTLYRDGQPVRMSTRAGEFITLRELMDEVGVDAARFFFLMRKVDSHLDFDLALATRRTDENPVYYLQYAHARISSILEFANRKVDSNADLSLIREEEAFDLIKKMAEYPEALEQAAQHLEPYRIVDYLRELAALFHRFYTLDRIVSDDEPLTKSRLLLTDCVRIVLRNGLAVLGVSAPRKM